MFEFTLACMGKANYVCLPDAGPEWRAAHEARCDMEELEENLRLIPWERLVKHNKKLAELLEFEAFMGSSGADVGCNFIKAQHGYPR
jgi:hypothetical protein